MRGRTRRYANPETKLPFYGIDGEIDKWERRVVYTCVNPEFNVHQVVDWLYPEEAVKVLRAAYPLTSEVHPDRAEEVIINGLQFELRIDCNAARICTPAAGQGRLYMGPPCGVIEWAAEVKRIVRQWDKVRAAVKWFNENGSVMSARYYFPAMGNFLPASHPFHQASGERPSTLKRPITEIAAAVREAAETITTALFCPHNEDRFTCKGVMLRIVDENDPSDNAKRSQFFCSAE
jgi:hypothetical protein